MLLTRRKNKSTFNAFFIIYLTSPSLTLDHCQLLPHEGGEGEHENRFFLGFSVNSLFWAILGPMASLNSGCNISIRVSVHPSKFVSSSQGYQIYSDYSFTLIERLLGKMLLPSEAILHGLASIFIDSSGWYAFT